MQNNLFDSSSMPSYLLTIRVESAEALMNGNKPYEFRKRFDNYVGKIRVFLYVTRPVGKIIGQVIFDTPIRGSINFLCTLLKSNSFDTEEKLKSYLKGCNLAYALPLVLGIRFKEPVGLEEIRNTFPGFNPPMSFLKLDSKKYISVRDYLLERN